MLSPYPIQAISFVESVVTALLMTIMIGMATPTLSYWAKRMRMEHTVDHISTALSIARLSAMAYHSVVTVCPLIDGMCNKMWEKGWSVFIDHNANGILDDDDALLKIFPKLHQRSQVFLRSFPSRAYFQYAPEGTTFHQNGTFYYCPTDQSAPFARQVIVNQTGRLRLENKAIC